jgi:CubicO group peptidase (beta-lactamase class C family)
MKHLICLPILLFHLNACADQKLNSTVTVETASTSDLYSSLSTDSTLFNQLSTMIKLQKYPNIHSVVVAKNGSIVYEHYFVGKDQNYGRDIGVVTHNESTLHDLRSITKSIISACVGIAIDKGWLKSVNQNISEFFPEKDQIFINEKANWTIQDFLTMTTGLTWNEDLPYNDPRNDEIKMTLSDDPIQYVLSKELENQPGRVFNYIGGATQILAEIIERASKYSIDQFADKFLFKPIGINNYEWNKYSVWGKSDKFVAPSGLRLTSKDIMKYALLYRNKGKQGDVQILPEAWINQSFEQQIEFPSKVAKGNDGYGYQVWMWPDTFLNSHFKMFAAIGNGGQNIFWDLEHDLIIVTTAGNYNNWDIKNDSYALVKEQLYPIFSE